MLSAEAILHEQPKYRMASNDNENPCHYNEVLMRQHNCHSHAVECRPSLGSEMNELPCESSFATPHSLYSLNTLTHRNRTSSSQQALIKVPKHSSGSCLPQLRLPTRHLPAKQKVQLADHKILWPLKGQSFLAVCITIHGQDATYAGDRVKSRGRKGKRRKSSRRPDQGPSSHKIAIMRVMRSHHDDPPLEGAGLAAVFKLDALQNQHGITSKPRP